MTRKEEFAVIKLETFPTKDILDNHVNGSLTVIWRDWDKIIKNPPKMVYVSSVNPGEIKGPHIHTKRNSYFVCVEGKVMFVIKDKHGKYVEIESSADEPVLVLADVAWRPNDNEMKNTSFDDYDWEKWKKT